MAYKTIRKCHSYGNSMIADGRLQVKMNGEHHCIFMHALCPYTITIILRRCTSSYMMIRKCITYTVYHISTLLFFHRSHISA
jgi:hypothetical protein